MFEGHDPGPTRHQAAVRRTYATLTAGERVTFPANGGHVVELHRDGASPATVLVTRERAFDAEGNPRAIDADPTWRLHYRMPGHDCTFLEGRFVGEALAAAAWERLCIDRPGLQPA